MRETLNIGVGGLILIFLFVLPPQAETQYVGAKRCRPCHLPQFNSWQKTKMSQAFELLKPGVRADAKRAKNLDADKDYTHDSKCLPCHVTGYGQPGGFESVETTPALVGVQCEVCHGAGGGYMKPNLMSLRNKNYKRADVVAAGLTIPDEETCRTCHNPESSFYKPFDYESRKAQGTHKHLPLKYEHE